MKHSAVLFLVLSGFVCTMASAESAEFSPYLDAFIPPEQASFRSCQFEHKCDLETECRPSRDCQQIPRIAPQCTTEFVLKNLGFGIKTRIPTVKCRTMPVKAFAACEEANERERKECLLKRQASEAQCRVQVETEEARCNYLKDLEVEFAKTASSKLRAFVAKLSDLDYKGIPEAQISILKRLFDKEILEKIRIIQTHNDSLFNRIFLSDKDSMLWTDLPAELRIDKFQDSPFILIENYVIMPPNWSGDVNIYQAVYIGLSVEVYFKYVGKKYYEIERFAPDHIGIYALSQAEKICKTPERDCK